MVLKIYNTLSRKKEIFKPLDPHNVRLYACGPTVYDYAHLGNGRSTVVFDCVYRILQFFYPHVTFVRNITDVDDKINAKAHATGESIHQITARTTQLYHQDMAALGVLSPTHEPKATDHMPHIIKFIQLLLDKGHAYEAEGHVLFDVSSMPTYGQLSKQPLKDMIAGARVETAPYKKNPTDFVLWKPSTDDLPGWQSPWGRGRPGWHIECSAMSETYLGHTFDLHCGGQDLIFPHHENEIAQSLCAYGQGSFAQYWLHAGMLMVDGEKMSKSLGNFFTVHQMLERYPGEALRFYFLQTHYHQPLNWTEEGVARAKHTLDKFYHGLRAVKDIQPSRDQPCTRIVAALSDDFNIPKALVRLHEILTSLNTAQTKAQKAVQKGKLLASARVLGLLEQDPDVWFQSSVVHSSFSVQEIDALILERQNARQKKDFKRADQIRHDLEKQGILLEDKPDGAVAWRYR